MIMKPLESDAILHPVLSRPHVYDTGKPIPPDAKVRYRDDLNGHPVAGHTRYFHRLLVLLTQAAGKMPDEILQRYGMDPYQTYCEPCTGEDQRTAMRRAAETLLFDHDIEFPLTDQPQLEIPLI
jgi:hypothetical protein